MNKRKQRPYPRCKYCIYLSWDKAAKENRCILQGGIPMTCNSPACDEFVHRYNK